MATYYIDSVCGKETNDGLSQFTPKSHYANIDIKPGDTILIKAGSVFNDCIKSPSGEEGNVITWDMYAEGEKPLFTAGFDAYDENLWQEVDKNIWAYKGKIPSDVCNIIFNNDDHCGILAWEYEDLNAQGKWHYTHMGFDIPGRTDWPDFLIGKEKVLYLYSEGNPCKVYTNIVCALYAKRMLLTAKKHVRVNNMSFKYSGVHGYGDGDVKDVKIANCEFRFIGGCVWDRFQRIRFGNAIEVWEYGEDFTVENCYFDQIYDSCTTHQGFKNVKPCVRINIINNIFKNYGMSAYELRDLIAVDSHFDGNICIGAGLGFSLQGETPPRKSELWPQIMGHHLFIWRISKPSENGCITVRNNVFHQAPYGAAIYSTIAPEAEKQLRFSNNVYYKSEDTCLVRLGGENYTKSQFALYQKEQHNDNASRVENIF